MSKKFKYTFIHLKDKIIAISTYAGRTVKGIAKCSPEDSFDPAAGEKLAAARCNEKVAKKRVKNAEKKLEEALRIQCEATRRVYKMTNYLDDSKKELAAASSEIETLLKTL